jgi:hypothetical protein
MKKILIMTACLAALAVTSCGRKSEASREQISNAHAQAHEMLEQAGSHAAATAITDSAALK